MEPAHFPHFVIVGGGIAGLAAAHRLVELSREREQPLRFTLLEASGRLGGTIGTEKRDGFLLELGPDSFISENPWALALCRRLGLESGRYDATLSAPGARASQRDLRHVASGPHETPGSKRRERCALESVRDAA